MKFLAFLVLVVSCGCMGGLCGISLTRRRRELETLTLGVELLETEMLFAQNPLWLSFNNVGERLGGTGSAFFLKMGHVLQEKSCNSPTEALERVLNEIKDRSCLTEDDKEILVSLCCDLGVMDMARQKRRLQAVADELRSAAANAGGVERKWRRVWDMGGWMFGLVFGLLLI